MCQKYVFFFSIAPRFDKKTVNALIKKLYFGADLDKAYMLSAFLPSMSFHTENVTIETTVTKKMTLAKKWANNKRSTISAQL